MMLFGFGLGKWLKLYRFSSHESFRLNVRVEGGGSTPVPRWTTMSHRHTRAILAALAWFDTYIQTVVLHACIRHERFSLWVSCLAFW
jgi:hypothetical protein